MDCVLFITVKDREENRVRGASVTVRAAGASDWRPLHFDEERGAHVSDPIERGDAVLRVEAEGYASQEIPLELKGAELHTSVCMGREGEPYYVVHGRRIYFEPEDRGDAIADRKSLPVRKATTDAGPSFLTPSIEVTTEKGMTRSELEELVRPFGLRVTYQDDWAPNIYIVESEEAPGLGFGAVPETLMSLPGIVTARSLLDGEARLTAAVTPPDVDFPLQFHTHVTRVPEAWGLIPGNFGSADVIVAVHDGGVPSDLTGTSVAHPQFNVVVNGGTLKNRPGLNARKLLFAYDFGPLPADSIRPGNQLVTSHGSWTAGVISAANDGKGVIGAAANTRLCSYVMHTGLTARMTHNFDFMGGFQPSWKIGTVPPYDGTIPAPFETGRNPIPGAHIINCSHTLAQLPPLLKETLQRLTLFGRGRRGTLVFSSTGNMDQNCRLDGAWAENTNVMRVSASTLDLREEEVRMNYSSYADKGDPIVDFCAPSESHNVFVPTPPPLPLPAPPPPPPPPDHFPPLNFSIITTDVLGTTGNMRGRHGASALNKNVLDPGKNVVKVTATALASFTALEPVLIRDTTNPLHAELHKIAAKTPPDTITLENPLGYRYAIGSAEITMLVGPDKGFTDQFGGTSAAAPQASAIAALMLSVNSALTWVEVRELMRSSAVPINLRYRGSVYKTGDAFRYRWIDPAGVSLVDADGLLRITRRTNTDASPLAAGSRSLKLLDAKGVEERQALLLGAETLLQGVHAKNATILNVASANGFAKDDEIFLGKDSQTVLIDACKIGDSRIWVQSVDGFLPGDAITIEPGVPNAEQATIDSIERMLLVPAADRPNIDNSDAETGLKLKTPLTKNHAVRTVVEIADTEREGPHTIKLVAGTTLELVGQLAAAHPDLRLVRKKNSELRAVLSVQGDQVEIDPLRFDHLPSESVGVGLVATYSLTFGHGRLDAQAAVQAAIDYDHNERDLMIRNFLGDDGVTKNAPGEVESPDIWLRNDAPTVKPPNYKDALPPHQRPEITIDPAIHIGAGRNDLEVSGSCTSPAERTFTLRIDGTGPTDTFEWSVDGGTPTSAPITVAVQDLSDGVKVHFDSVTGHTLNDRWIIKARLIASRFLHVRVRNRGSKPSFTVSKHSAPSSPDILDVAQSRILLCTSDGFPVRRFWSINPAPGKDDLDVVTKYTGSNPRALYTVEITASSGTGDTFKWYRDGTPKTSVNLTPGPLQYTLDGGVKVRFGSATGHKVGDRWDLYARGGPEAFLNLDHYWEVPPGVANEFDPASGRAGTRTLKTTGIDALAEGVDVVHTAPWPEALRPPTNNPLKPPTKPLRLFALGEVVPHDGKLDGFAAKDNNNFSFRELSFATFRFTEANPLDPLEGQVDISSLTATQKPFRIEVRSTACTFATERVRLRFTTAKGTAKEVFVFRHSNGSWGWAGTPPSWVTVGLPRTARDKLGAQTNAAGEQFDISFETTYTLSTIADTLQVDVEILSDFRDLAVATATHTMKLIEAAPEPTGTSEAVAAAQPQPVSHVFADIGALQPQTPAQAYGPVAGDETKRYRATSLFKATATPDVNAYAVCDGFVALQRDPANDHTVNLILRPFHQPIAGFTPIRYFVYRGLRLDEFLKGKTGTDAALMQVDALASPLVKAVRIGFLDLNPAATNMPATVMGYDPAQPATGRLDDVFFRVGGSQLHYVTRGTILGRFDNDPAREIGFEVMVEEGNYAPTLGYARGSSYEVDISAPPADPFALRLKQEEILNFLDPAAFYGLHVPDGEVETPGGSPFISDGVFTNVVARFHSQHRLYVRVSSENGSSLHFHRNYDVSGNQIQLGGTTGPLTALPYGDHGWPIAIVDASVPATSAAANVATDFHELQLQLPRGDNEKPVVYVEHGDIQPHCIFVRGSDLVTGTGPWTRTLLFRYPNTGAAGAKTGVASVIRLIYGRLENKTPTVVSPATVLKTQKYSDNVFGPIDRTSAWAGPAGIKWITTQANRYVDADSELGWRQVMTSGLAQSGGPTPRVLLYAVANARDSDAQTGFVPIRGLPDGASDAATFFAEANLFGMYQLELDEIDDNGAVRTLQLRQRPKEGFPPTSALLLGLAKTEFDILLALSGAGLSKDSLRTILLDGETPGVDKNGRPYRRFRVGIQGLKTAGGAYASEFPAADIPVYTVDRHFFASKAFAAAEPLPTTYARNYEEEKGARQWPVRERFIDAVDTGASSITIKGVDWRDEVVPGVTLNVTQPANKSQYTVSSVTLNGQDTVIVLSGGPALQTGATLGRVATVAKPVEDRFIDFDQNTAVAGSNMRGLVQAFANALTAIVDDQAAVESVVTAEAPKLLKRARDLAGADRKRADDYERCLYWARLHMGVTLKDHPFCRTSLSARNALVSRLERHTRGYDVDFAGVLATEHKVLLTGFDPYGLAGDPARSNPAGAVALALHGKPIASSSGKTARVATAIFPVRYREFDAGRVEEFMNARLIDPANPLSPNASKWAEMIVTLSQNGSRPYYDLERFAGRLRGGDPDNEFVRFPSTKIGDKTYLEFYESTLPSDKLVPGPFNDAKKQTLFFDQSWEDSKGSHKHPREGGTNGNTPTATAPKNDAVRGSGGFYLSNEIFYRTAQCRTKLSSTTVTGHFHLPATALMKVGIEDVIVEVEQLIKRWLNSLP